MSDTRVSAHRKQANHTRTKKAARKRLSARLFDSMANSLLRPKKQTLEEFAQALAEGAAADAETRPRAISMSASKLAQLKQDLQVGSFFTAPARPQVSAPSAPPVDAGRSIFAEPGTWLCRAVRVCGSRNPGGMKRPYFELYGRRYS